MAKKRVVKEKNNIGPKAKGLFDHINHIREVQSPTYFDNLSESDKKTWSTYMILRALSMDTQIIESVNEIQKYWELPPKLFYHLCTAVTPKRKAFFPFIKGKKEDKYSKELVDLVANHFLESRRHVTEYLDMMTVEQIKSIVSLYGYTEKEMKKLISN